MLRFIDKILSALLVILILAFGTTKFGSYRKDRDATPGKSNALKEGERMPDQKLAYMAGGWRDKARIFRRTTTWQGLSSRGCVVAIFFESSCEWCHETAKFWSGKKGMKAGMSVIPVQWVTVNPGDDHAAAMLDSLRIGGGVLSMPSLAEANRIGVVNWPMAFLVGHDGVFLKKLRADNDSLTAIPDTCKSPAIAVLKGK